MSVPSHTHLYKVYHSTDFFFVPCAGATLQHLQSEISRLDNSTNPVQVTDLLDFPPLVGYEIKLGGWRES